MALATLIVGIVAALAAIAAVAVPLWLQRPRLALSLEPDWSADDRAIQFKVKIENLGATAISQIHLFALALGESAPPTGNLGTHALQPGESRIVPFAVIRPQRVDIAPGELVPSLKIPMIVFARYRRREQQIRLPEGPLPIGPR